MLRWLCLRGMKPEHALRDTRVPAGAGRCLCNPTGDASMQWQTPTAIDFRFGFEITMYVAAR